MRVNLFKNKSLTVQNIQRSGNAATNTATQTSNENRTFAAYPLYFGYASKTKEKYLEQGAIPCPCCGKKMLSNKVYNSLGQFIHENKNLPNEEFNKKLIEYLEKYKSSMHPTEKSLFSSVKSLYEANPDASFAEFLFNLMDEKSDAFDSKQKNLIEKIMKNLGKKAYNNNAAALEFSKKILLPSTVTIEHIKPDSDNGLSGMSNYLLECFECNNGRGKKPFAQWVSLHPKMKINLQKYLDKIIELINDGKIDDKNYPQKLAETIEIQTKGKIKLDFSALKFDE